MKLRGPGDLFGIRQSGILDFKLGDIFQDAAILKEASDTAAFIMEKSDKFLSKDSPAFQENDEIYPSGGWNAQFIVAFFWK